MNESAPFLSPACDIKFPRACSYKSVIIGIVTGASRAWEAPDEYCIIMKNALSALRSTLFVWMFDERGNCSTKSHRRGSDVSSVSDMDKSGAVSD